MKTEATKSVKTGRQTVRITGREVAPGNRASILINGAIQTIGAIVEVSQSEARNLIDRGVAVDATEAEVTAAAGNVVVAPHRENNWNDAA